MVTRINLLPPEIKQRDKRERLVVYMFLSLVLLAAFMMAVKFQRDLKISEAKAELEGIRTEAASVEKSIAQLKEYEDRQKELVRLEGIVNAAMAGATKWSKVLTDISMVIPNDVVLKQVSFTKDGATFSAEAVPLEGQAAGHKPVAKWLVNLSKVPSFNRVWLGSSNKGQDGRLTFDTTVKFQSKSGDQEASKVPPAKGN